MRKSKCKSKRKRKKSSLKYLIGKTIKNLDKEIEKMTKAKEETYKKYKTTTDSDLKGELAKEFCKLTIDLGGLKREKKIREMKEREIKNTYKDLLINLLNVGDEKAILLRFMSCLYKEYKHLIDSGCTYDSQEIKELDKYIERAHELESEILSEE